MAGLRERKKARVRADIQHHALALFREQGYSATTVDQIAAAAEVSPSTFFRYFPSKEDVVVHDALDPLFIEAVRAQPAHLPPIPALRAGMRAVRDDLSDEDLAFERQRQDLMMANPELRARFLGELIRSLDLLADLVAERVHRSPDDFAVRSFAGAIAGVIMSTMFAEGRRASDHFIDLIDAALAHLDAGLPL